MTRRTQKVDFSSFLSIPIYYGNITTPIEVKSGFLVGYNSFRAFSFFHYISCLFLLSVTNLRYQFSQSFVFEHKFRSPRVSVIADSEKKDFHTLKHIIISYYFSMSGELFYHFVFCRDFSHSSAASRRKLSFMAFNLASEYSRDELIQPDFKFCVVENSENILMFMEKNSFILYTDQSQHVFFTNCATFAS